MARFPSPQLPSIHRVTRLLDSLSLSTSSSKLTKLFHHSSSSSSSATKKLNPTMQYLLQAGPQGLIRIWPTALSEEMNYCSFMVNMTTTSAEIIKLVFEKYELVDDPRRYYVCEMGLGKGGRPLEILSVLYYLYYSFPFPGLKCGLKRKTRKSLNMSKHLLEVSFLVLNNTSMLIFCTTL